MKPAKTFLEVLKWQAQLMIGLAVASLAVSSFFVYICLKVG